MRKLVVVLTVVVFTASIVACTPQSINDGTKQAIEHGEVGDDLDDQQE